MKALRAFTLAVSAMCLTSCAHITSYHVDAFNATGGIVDRAKVSFETGKEFEWGAMNPNVGAGMWPMLGPLGRQANIQWEDDGGRKYLQSVSIPHGGAWNTVKFVLHKDGTVSVETRQR